MTLGEKLSSAVFFDRICLWGHSGKVDAPQWQCVGGEVVMLLVLTLFILGLIGRSLVRLV